MEKTKYIYFLFIHVFLLSSVCVAQNSNCQKLTEYSGSESASSRGHVTKCWIILIPEDSYVRLDLYDLQLRGLSCSSAFINVTVAGTGEQLQFCSQDTYRKPITALSDVNITYVHAQNQYTTSFKFNYSIENLICAQKNHFRCSNHSCIHQYQVCDGVKDCENGIDEIGCETGVASVKGVNISRENSIIWLKKQQSADSFGWGRNTHRAITALYLTENATFKGHNMDEEIITKQLELQTSVALLRNSSDPLSVSELSMFINALTVTCHNPRQFYGYDLLQILGERVAASKLPNPGAFLTLCNSNWTFPESHTRIMLKTLRKSSEYPFHLDIQAMTVMALSCVKNRTQDFVNILNASSTFNSTIKQFIAGQLADGSFGNVYTTALVTQALLSSGQENNKLWKINSTIKFLMRELNSSADFLSVYLTLPIFKGKSLVDVGNVKCTKHRKHGEDDEISDVTSKLGGKMRIQYSLFVGDQKDIIHTMYLRMPENSSAYDVMRMAQVADSKYKFLHRYVSGHMYVYEIAGITNDPEAGKFWLLYTGDSLVDGTVKHHTKSPEKFILKDGDHLIMWYKTAHV